MEIDAEAQAEQMRRKAKGEADAIYAKMEAEARGIQEKLSRQAEGLANIVKAAGSADEAVRLMVTEKLESIVSEQVKAISNLKIDKVTVWDNGENKDGKTSTANFLSGMLKSRLLSKRSTIWRGSPCLKSWLLKRRAKPTGKLRAKRKKAKSRQKRQVNKNLTYGGTG